MLNVESSTQGQIHLIQVSKMKEIYEFLLVPSSNYAQIVHGLLVINRQMKIVIWPAQTDLENDTQDQIWSICTTSY